MDEKTTRINGYPINSTGAYRVLVAHPQQQHSYRLAVALKRRGMLFAYVTTIYDRPGSLTHRIKGLLPQRFRAKASSRSCSELDDKDVVQLCEVGGLLYRLFLNVRALRRWRAKVMAWTNDRFARAVARYAMENEVDAVICYDSASYLLFEILEREAPDIVRIVDMSAANRLYLKAVYERDFQLKPEFAEKLRGEWGQVLDPKENARTERELATSQWFLCGSSVVRRSLAWSGVSPDRCPVCHYGVELDAFPYSERTAKRADEPLVFVFVGGTKELKGLAYLLDAFSGIDSGRAQLVIVGKNTLSRRLVEKYGAHVTFAGEVPHDEVSRYLEQSDVMLFPSLGDGFPLSIMEALACGVPVVCSDNTGAADVIESGINGFVIPTQNQQSLDEAIEWFLSNRQLIPAMAENAVRTARVYTWDAYSTRVADIVQHILDDDRSGRKGAEEGRNAERDMQVGGSAPS